MSDDAQETKVCCACGGKFPATLEYFFNSPRSPGGLSGRCKECRREQKRVARYLREHPTERGAARLKDRVQVRAWSRANIRTDETGRWKNYWED